jgi:hypothetical protein
MKDRNEGTTRAARAEYENRWKRVNARVVFNHESANTNAGSAIMHEVQLLRPSKMRVLMGGGRGVQTSDFPDFQSSCCWMTANIFGTCSTSTSFPH